MTSLRCSSFPTGRVASLVLPLVAAGIFLIALNGCSSSHSLQIDAVQPIYFGNPPQSVVPRDSAHVESLKSILVTTSHVAESGKSIGNETITFSNDASEQVVGDVVVQVQDAFENDRDRFIGGGTINATVEAYISLSTYMTYFLGAIFMNDAASSEGLGEASSETIEISGTMYRIRRTDR